MTLNVKSEAMQPAKGKRQPQSQATGGREFRQNHGGVNYGNAPLLDLSKFGLEMEM